MRGSPFLQAVFMVVAFALAGVPVYRLTRPAAASAAVAGPVAVETSAAKPGPLDVEAVFAPAPADFEIKNLGQTVLAGRGPQARFQTRWTTAVPPEGVDLVIQAHWPASADAAAAARITVRFADGRQVEKSFWANANGTLEEVYTVPGVPGVPTP